MQKPALKARRIIELDLLRGFFIVVIILDHLQFWPSPWQYMTGQGRLWVSAAEGFFIISGLLIGYLRAYKGAHSSLRDMSKKLWARAGMLWLWGVIITAAALMLSYALPGPTNLLPALPGDETMANPFVLIWRIITLDYASAWIYFLRLYAIMLALTPLFLWCIRHKKVLHFAVLSLGIYLASLLIHPGEEALQWQVLFFGAAILGWKLEAILAWFRTRPQVRTATIVTLIVTTLASMVLSYAVVHGWTYVESPATSISREAYVSIRANVDPVFSNQPLTPARIALSFLWFSGLLALFHVMRKPLERWLGWLLLIFGNASLTAYCLQAIVLIPIVKFIQPTENFWYNGLIGALVIVLFWSLMKQPIVQKILPK